MSPAARFAVVLLLAPVAAGCGKPAEPSAGQVKPGKAAEPSALVGIEPRTFECDSMITAAELGAMVGGTARAAGSQLPPPDGTAAPCSYAVTTAAATGSAAPTTTAWTFDFDCRPGMQRTADALFAQYAKSSADNVVAYNRQSDAGVPVPPDARPPSGPPTDAVEVPVGARGLDHHGQGILFLDDDAPCYVRVNGPGAEARLALAQHLAKRLTPATAPMTPRAP